MSIFMCTCPSMHCVGHRGVKKYNTNAIVMFQLLLKDLSC